MREYMEGDEPVQAAELPDICQHLRTKTAFGTNTGYTPWQTGESQTASYWCLKTMQSAGPDDGLAHPHKCKQGRACFRSVKNDD